MKKYLIIVVLFAFACNKGEMQTENSHKMLEEVAEAYDDQAESRIVYSETEPMDQGKNSEPINDLKLIKTGSCTFETQNLKATADQINKAISKYKGYASNETENKSSYRINRTITIRVPSGSFDGLLADISVGVNRFDEREIHVSDVTEQYYDLSARLKTKKQIEARYIQLLSRAGKITEVLEVERQIGEVRTEIDRIEGKLKYLQNQVSFSTLTIQYYESLEAEAEHNYGFFSKLRRSLVNGWDMVLSLCLGLASVWPLLLIGIGIYFVIRRFRMSKLK